MKKMSVFAVLTMALSFFAINANAAAEHYEIQLVRIPLSSVVAPQAFALVAISLPNAKHDFVRGVKVSPDGERTIINAFNFRPKDEMKITGDDATIDGSKFSDTEKEEIYVLHSVDSIELYNLNIEKYRLAFEDAASEFTYNIMRKEEGQENCQTVCKKVVEELSCLKEYPFDIQNTEEQLDAAATTLGDAMGMDPNLLKGFAAAFMGFKF